MIDIKNIKDLKSLIKNKVTENLNLEYKSAPALSNEDKKKLNISKFVSSMANSAGGVIIYGMKEFDDPKLKHLPEELDEIDGNEFSKEWLEHIINSSIKPKINGLKITPIYIDPSKNKVVYVINIPQSETAHQAKDFIYYKRYNFMSVPMEDYEIKDIMNRMKYPKIKLVFRIEKRIYYRSDPILQSQWSKKNERRTLSLNISQINIGNVLANYVSYFADIPSLIYEDHHSKYKRKIIDDIEYIKIVGDNTERDVVGSGGSTGYFYPKYGPSRFVPILPGLKSREETLILKESSIFDGKYIYWTVFADNASPRSGKIRLSEIEYEEIDEREKTR